MTATDVVSSFWKRKSILALFLAVALLVCHCVLCVGQQYTATVYIKYLEENAEDGLTTNGEKLNPYEITDPYVISKALNRIGESEAKANSIAQSIKVTPMNSAAEQEKYASWIDQFSDYKNTEEDKATPIYYRVQFTSREGIQFTRDFLSALIDEYRNFYTEKYVETAEIVLLPEATVVNADYFRAIELMQTQINYTISDLNYIIATDTDYRSAATGHSLRDLLDAYNLLVETEIAPIKQYVLNTRASKDISALIAFLEMNAEIAEMEASGAFQKAESQRQLMLSYAEKNKDFLYKMIGEDAFNALILGDVIMGKEYAMTVYDQLVMNYVAYMSDCGSAMIDKAMIDEYLSSFRTGICQHCCENNHGCCMNNAVCEREFFCVCSCRPCEQPDHMYVTRQISDIYKQYASLQELTEETLDGYNEYKSASVLMQVTGIRTVETLPDLIYYTISAVLALSLGAVVVVIVELTQRKKEDA